MCETQGMSDDLTLPLLYPISSNFEHLYYINDTRNEIKPIIDICIYLKILIFIFTHIYLHTAT